MSHVDIVSAVFKTTTEAQIRLSDAPVIGISYTERKIKPILVKITYAYERRTDDVWVTHNWYATSVDVTGYRVLKPWPNGELRISRTVGDSASWKGAFGRDVSGTEANSMPEWVVELMNEFRPSGEVSC